MEDRPIFVKGGLLDRVTRDVTTPGEHRLLFAVIALACRDCRGRNGHAESARHFLNGEGFEIYAKTLGLSPAKLREALARARELP